MQQQSGSEGDLGARFQGQSINHRFQNLHTHYRTILQKVSETGEPYFWTPLASLAQDHNATTLSSFFVDDLHPSSPRNILNSEIRIDSNEHIRTKQQLQSPMETGKTLNS